MSFFDQRKDERYDLHERKVEYALSPFDTEILEADILNISETGLCLLSSNYMPVGQEITIKNLMPFSSRTARVMWIEEYDNNFHLNNSDEVLFKIGLTFIL